MGLSSYACGKNRRNLRFVTFPTLLNRRAAETPNKAAHVFRTSVKSENKSHSPKRNVITFSELEETSYRLASSLLCNGIQPNDNIAILGHSSPEYVYMEFACLRISVLNFRLPSNIVHADELINVLETYQIKALVLSNIDMVESLEKKLPGFLLRDSECSDHQWPTSLNQIIFLEKPTFTVRTRIPHTSVDDLAAGSPKHRELVCMNERTQDPEDPAFVFPTSGSTGKAKFVLHSHFSVTNGVKLAQLIPSGVRLSDRPMSWAGGAPLASVIFGFTTVHVDSNLSSQENGIKQYLQIAHEEHVTDAFCMPYLLQDIIQETQKSNGKLLPNSFRGVIVSGERIPPEVLDTANQMFEKLMINYGQTEALVVASSSALLKDSESMTWMDLHPEVEIKITDDNGKVQPRGVPGNVLMRSPNNFLEYVNDPDLTRKTVDQKGWLKSGDIGIMNDDCQIKIVGRTKDIISRGGNKIYPSVIEGILERHPKVQTAVVVAVPDKRLFNEICACIVPTAGEPLTAEELRRFYQKHAVDDKAFVLPKYFMFCKEFPQNVNGKIDKIVLSQMAVDKFEL